MKSKPLIKGVTSEKFNDKIINALTASIAILDSDGTIIAVNDAWRAFARENGSTEATDYIGCNYFKECERAITAEDDETAKMAIAGFKQIWSGEVKNFSLEYPCHSPTKNRWFSMNVTSFLKQGSIYIVVAHENITVRKQAAIDLRESSELYRLLFNNSIDAILLTTPDGEILEANPAAEVMFGRTEKELQRIGRNEVADMSDPKNSDAMKQRDLAGHFKGEVTGLRADGSKFPMEITTSVYKNKNDELRTSMIIRDITERKQVLEQLQYHSRVLSNLNDIVIGTDEKFNIKYWNPAAERVFGWKPTEVMGRYLPELLQTEFINDDQESSIKFIIENDYWTGEVIQRTKEGKPVQVDARIITLKTSTGQITGYISANRDITNEKIMREKLDDAFQAIKQSNKELEKTLKREQHLARTDGLTGISNYRHFFDVATYELTMAKRYQIPLSILLFDIDKFKGVNDKFGHQFGDKILKGIAKVTGERLRESDVFARYGGEEFIILLPNTDARDAHRVAEDVRNHIAEFSLEFEGERVGVTISIGIAEFTREAGTLDGLVKIADKALYKAKQNGRNCSVRAEQQPW